MKKIPTLFVRKFENGKVVGITPEVTPGMEWVLQGEGIATVKYDGSCCAIINGEFYKRYDAKKGKPIPEGAIKCQEEPDPVTGHLPCWVKVDRNNPADKWFVAAYDHTLEAVDKLEDGTYEAVGKHFQGNPYNCETDLLYKHGVNQIDTGEWWERLLERSFDGIRMYLYSSNCEGIVFWKDGEPQCKIKRTDFGYAWPDRVETIGDKYGK